MLIVCPSCATSYMIDQAAVGPGGRTVRCARCKATWFAGGAEADTDVTAFVDSVIAEAERRPPAMLSLAAARQPSPTARGRTRRRRRFRRRAAEQTASRCATDHAAAARRGAGA